MNRRVLWGVLLAFGLALALRCPSLDERPMHNDEAVNAVKFGRLWTQGAYKYDPNEHHGPSLFYATLAVARLTSTPDFIHLSEVKLRLITVCFGVGLILLLPLMADGLGRNATIWAAIFTAVSPAMVFYSRYYIHEMLLVFFTLLALASGWRYWRSRKPGWTLLAGLGIGLMHATKETFVITLVVAVLGLTANYSWTRWLDAAAIPGKPARVNPWHVTAGIAVWLVVAIVLFTSFFSNASGMVDSVKTYLPWLRRAEGASPHIHPWTFYLHRLIFFHTHKGPVWSEALILALALIGMFAAFARRGLADANAGFVRFLAFYTVALTLAYSLISYKTTWNLLSFWDGMILLAGVGAVALLRAAKRRWAKGVVGLFLLIGAGHLAWQAWQLDVPYAADPGNPYDYAQTSPSLLGLVARVEKLAEASPQKAQMLVKVIAPDSDYWPLPWYLRNLGRVGWWDSLPDDPYAPVVIVSSKFHAGLDEKKTHVMVGYFALRPDAFLELYVELDLWRAYLAQNPPRPD
jgi:uncharacterized protein (TIGR03663 family)